MAKRKKGSRASVTRVYPNRIAELAKKFGMTYADVAERVSPPVHEITIARLATGRIDLTQEWMRRLGVLFNIPPTDLIAASPPVNLRRVMVLFALRSKLFAASHTWNAERQYPIMIPDDEALRNIELYGAEIADGSMSSRYPPGAVVVMSRLMQHPDEIVEGRRYHVRVTRSADQLCEETVRTLVRHADGRYFLRPESSDPDFQEWTPLDGSNGETVKLLGRVRYTVQRED